MTRPAALRAGESLIQTLWVGALWSVGYLVAPALFAHLPDRSMAGAMAGQLFTLVTWLSLACAAVLLPTEFRSGRPDGIRRLRLGVMSFMVLCLIASEWVVRPMMQAARLADGTPGEDFGLLHGVSAALWMLAALAGVLLVVSGALRVRRPAA